MKTARSSLALLKIGLVEQRQQRTGEAEKAYLEAIQLDPKQAMAYNNLAWLAAERKADLDHALAWATKAVALLPRDATCEDTLGWVYRARGEHDKAAVALRKASALEPQNPEVLYHLGVVDAEEGQTREARESLTKALATNRDFDGSSDAKARLASLSASH